MRPPPSAPFTTYRERKPIEPDSAKIRDARYFVVPSHRSRQQEAKEWLHRLSMGINAMSRMLPS